MKQTKKMLLFLMTCILFMSMSLTMVRAERYTYHVQLIARNIDSSGQEYTYTLYEGDYEYIPSEDKVTDFTVSSYVAPNYGKYQFKGWHISGKDRDELVGVVPITEDIVFVATYRMPGTIVTYTARYLDEATGQPIAESDVFYGSVGDQPVIGYKYIEGWEPTNARNMTKSGGLEPDPDKNVFDFTYRRITQQQQQQQQQQQANNQANANQNQGGNATPANPANPTVNPDNQGGNNDNPAVNPNDNQGENNENPAVNPDDNQGENIDDNQTPQSGPEEIIDIDDNKTPEGTPDPNQNPNPNKPKTGFSGLIEMLRKNGFAFGSGFFLVLLFLIFLLRRRKNKNNG